MKIVLIHFPNYFRYNTLLKQEDEIRAYNAKMKPIWDKEKAEKLAKINRENMLALAKEVGVTVKIDFIMIIHRLFILSNPLL